DPLFTPTVAPFHELRVCLLDDGEVWIDNVSVREDPGLGGRELIQNGNFDSGLLRWRKTGTHITTRPEADPDNPGNTVMRLVATGPGSYLNNIVETTLKSGNTVVPVQAGREYEISFDARWITGTPLLRWELYYNKVAHTVRLTQQQVHGTPGRRNSRAVENLGPTFRCLTHVPAVPRLREPIRVAVQASDPDQIKELTLAFAAAGRPWIRVPMMQTTNGWYEAPIPPQTNAVQIQYFVEGLDAFDALSTSPPGGTNSRAYLKVESTIPARRVPVLRILADARESAGLMPLTNLLSDAYLPCTFIWDDREVIHGAGFRLHGSMWSRQNQDSVGFNVQFPAGNAYKGIRTGMILRRRDHGEIVCRHILANGTDVMGNYDEFLYLITPLQGNAGIARVIFGNDDDIWLRSSFNGENAQVFKMEGIREFTTSDNNTAEGYKLAMPIGWIQAFDPQNQGDDKEQYRWSTLISNRRGQDDYSRYIAMAKVWGLTGANLQQAVPGVMDVEQWSKIFSLQALCGVADVYTIENPHNLGYAVRPSDGLLLPLQNDWSFYFQLSTSQPLIGGQNLSKIFNLPVYKRVYYGVIQEWLRSTYNRDYMSRWVQHYGFLAEDNYGAFLDYIVQRSQFARTQFPRQIPFEITNNGGTNFTTNSPVVLVQGRGWIDVHRIVFSESSNEVAVTWLDGERWQTLAALAQGTNVLSYTAYSRAGTVVGSDSIEIVSSVTDRSQRDSLRIAELMYHPADPSSAEREAGFTDSDEFEFVELVNIGTQPVALRGAQFTVGIRFAFSGGSLTQLEPGARVLIVKNTAAFAFRYSGAGPVAGSYAGSLSNGGERVRLVDAFGDTIDEVTYSTSGTWPWEADGLGASLERIDPGAPGSGATAWTVSRDAGGTPGRAALITPGLSAAVENNGSVRLKTVVPAGSAFFVEFTERLETQEWQTLASLPNQAFAYSQTFVQAQPAGALRRFYRMRPEASR
ncbi:MAG: lamin tail domain-containing protein, partial [Verrucomicrobia bacterium]|nr:lamin tail domain-containing protein [Verrucomicrobiota bacterium]